MKIKKITLENFGKHSEREFILDPITIVKGSNGSGKSSLVEAISYAMLGSVRRLNKKLEDISKLSSNENGCLSVKLETNENIITRSIIQKRNKLSETLECSNSDESLNNTERQLFLKERYSLDELLINPLNFVNLSSTDKSKYILNLLNSVNNSDETKEVLINEIKAKFKDNLVTESCFNEFKNNLSLIENIDNSLKFVSSYKRITAKEIKDTIDNAYKISDLKNNIESFNKLEIDKIPEVEERLNEMKVKLNIQQQVEKKYNSIKTQIKSLEALKSKNIDINAIKQEAETIKTKINKLYEVKEDENSLIQLEKLNEKIYSIKEKGLKNNSNIELIEEKIKQLIDLNLRISSISQSKRCVIDNSIICNNSFSNKNNSLKNEVIELKKEISKLQDIRNQLRREYLSVNLEIAALTKKVEKSKEEYKNTQSIIRTLNEELDKKRIAYMEYINCENKINVLKEELNQSIPEDTSMLVKFIASTEEELKELYKKKNNYIELTQALILAEKENINRVEKENLLNISKELEKMLKAKKLEMLEDGIKPFKENMNKILQELNFNYSIFVKNDGKKAIIGLTKGDLDIEMDRLSTGETMMFIISLIGAIYEKIKAKFRLLVLDDLDNLDMINLDKLLSNKNVLTKYFDNVILIGILSNIELSKYNSDDCSIIEM